jgi:uncharacterized protein YejL (UPF0352 family)
VEVQKRSLHPMLLLGNIIVNLINTSQRLSHINGAI